MASSPTPAIDDAKSERWHSTSSNLPALGATLRAQAIPRPASSSSGAASHDSPISNSVRNLEPPELWVIESGSRARPKLFAHGRLDLPHRVVAVRNGTRSHVVHGGGHERHAYALTTPRPPPQKRKR